MADGSITSGMGGENAGSRFAYSPVLQAAGKIGVYDDAARDEEFGLAPGRGQVFAFIATIAAIGGVNFLQIAPGAQPLTLYTQGSTADGTPAGIPGVQTDAESSAGPAGGIVRNAATFVSVGMMIDRLPCWSTPAGAADVLATRISRDYLDGNAMRYGERLQDLVENAASIEMDVSGGTRKQSREHLGSISDWRRNVNGLDLPGHFWLFSSDYGSGGQSSDMELTAYVAQTRTLQVEENAANPFLAGTQVVVPFRMRQIGYTVCGDPEAPGDVCNPRNAKRGASLRPDQVQNMVEGAVNRALKSAGLIR